jgi:uncharacterized membrane protein YoaK (UPF0700 family)
MNFLKTRTWTATEIVCLKWGSMLAGAVIGAYLADLVKAYVWVFVASVIVLSIKPVSGYFRKD